MNRLLAAGLVVATAAVAGLGLELYAQTRPAEAASAAAPRAPVAVAVAVAPKDVPRRAAPVALPRATPAPAPTDANAAAHAERETWFGRIRDEHVGHESWDDAGLALLQQVGRDAAAVSNEGCYMAGCIAEITFASLANYRDAIDRLTRSPAYTGWTGAKHITAPEQLPDGDVIVAVVLERPD